MTEAGAEAGHSDAADAPRESRRQRRRDAARQRRHCRRRTAAATASFVGAFAGGDVSAYSAGTSAYPPALRCGTFEPGCSPARGEARPLYCGNLSAETMRHGGA